MHKNFIRYYSNWSSRCTRWHARLAGGCHCRCTWECSRGLIFGWSPWLFLLAACPCWNAPLASSSGVVAAKTTLAAPSTFHMLRWTDTCKGRSKPARCWASPSPMYSICELHCCQGRDRAYHRCQLMLSPPARRIQISPSRSCNLQFNTLKLRDICKQQRILPSRVTSQYDPQLWCSRKGPTMPASGSL